MGRPPGAHPLDVRRPAEVVPILRLVEPAALTGRLARLAALRLGAVVLMAQIARVGSE